MGKDILNLVSYSEKLAEYLSLLDQLAEVLIKTHIAMLVASEVLIKTILVASVGRHDMVFRPAVIVVKHGV